MRTVKRWEKDLLRKVYPVAPFILAGFAGSVSIGLSLIASLQEFVARQKAPPGVAWRPDWLADQWMAIARGVFASATPEEQANGAQIMILGPSPAEHMGVPEFARTFVITLNWPDFVPIIADKGLSIAQIGSGSDVPVYRGEITRMVADPNTSVLALQGGGPGFGAVLGSNLRQLITKYPEPGIGRHLFVDTCRLGGFSSGTNDVTIHHRDGRNEEFKMPPVASSRSEFIKLCQASGITAARAIA